MTKKIGWFLALVLLLFSVGSAYGEATEPAGSWCGGINSNVTLAQVHLNKYHGIRFCYPGGWALEEEDQSLFLAPSEGKEFWEDFDPASDFYIVISSISPYLSTEDAKEKRGRSVKEFARSTVHSLTVTEKATVVSDAQTIMLGDNEAAAFLVRIGERFHYQIIIRLASDKLATVAVNGMETQQAELSALVDAIAYTVKKLE